MGLDFFGGGVLSTEETVNFHKTLPINCFKHSKSIVVKRLSLLIIFFWLLYQQLRLSGLEKKAVNDMFVVLSDVWLDNEEVHSLSSRFCFLRSC